jgi:DNA-binding XRE family transcriptional regulator
LDGPVNFAEGYKADYNNREHQARPDGRGSDGLAIHVFPLSTKSRARL